MKDQPFQTPVLFMVFNRPDVTKAVFAEIRKLKPARLFIAADGPRPDRPDDAEKCRLTREAVSRVDWPCEVKTLFRDRNLGCRNAPSSAITWFFEHVTEGIIVEDDCIPDPTFFPFCAELLERYRDDPRVMQIAGNSLLGKGCGMIKESYYFSRIHLLWGWATWRRAWALYDIEMKKWPEARDSGTIKKILHDPEAYKFWERHWNTYYNGLQNSWDRPWAFAAALNDGLCATPRVNLITNIGFGSEATHTKDDESALSNMSRSGLTFPLVHPMTVAPNERADAYAYHHAFGVNFTHLQKIGAFLQRSVKRLVRK